MRVFNCNYPYSKYPLDFVAYSMKNENAAAVLICLHEYQRNGNVSMLIQAAERFSDYAVGKHLSNYLIEIAQNEGSEFEDIFESKTNYSSTYINYIVGVLLEMSSDSDTIDKSDMCGVIFALMNLFKNHIEHSKLVDLPFNKVIASEDDKHLGYDETEYSDYSDI